MFLKQKLNAASGDPERLKARLVADGSQQKRAPSINDELHLPTASTITMVALFAFLAIASNERRILGVPDKQASLQAATPDHTPIYTKIGKQLVEHPRSEALLADRLS